MGRGHQGDDLHQWFSTFLMPRPFNTVPHVVVDSQPANYFVAMKIADNCNFAIVMNHNVDIGCAGYLICKPCERV